MTERKFKVGDRIRLVGQRDYTWGDCLAHTGDTGEVSSLFLDGELVGVQFDEQEPYQGVFMNGWAFEPHELELIEGGD